MARGYNKHTIIGNLGADPDIRYGKNNSIIARISVATTELVSVQWEHKEETEWHTVVLFNKRAETARDYLRKGSEIFVEGRSKTNRWTDSIGQKRSHKEILATDMRTKLSRTDSRTLNKLLVKVVYLRMSLIVQRQIFRSV